MKAYIKGEYWMITTVTLYDNYFLLAVWVFVAFQWEKLVTIDICNSITCNVFATSKLILVVVSC